MIVTLIDKVTEAPNTKSFFWKPRVPITWLPGQYLYYTLPKPLFKDSRGSIRDFTIASSPTEKRIIQFTTRIRAESGFKQTLDKLSIGDQIEADGPHGSYILDENLNGPQVFLAGGIGITPFRSFIKYNIDKNLKIPVYLIYSNSDNDFVFKHELDTWQKDYDFVKINYYNSGLFGHLDKLKINEFIGNWKLEIGNSNLWLVGPPPFVSAMEEVLEEIGIEEDKIHTEKFTGY